MEEADQLLPTTKYNGRNKFTFAMYVAIHIRAHNILLTEGEERSPSQRVRDLLHGITDPRLDNAKMNI
jgi:hypothetical protein